MKLTHQCATIVDHLRTRSLSSWEAEGVYRIRRLASRISELVALGYEVEKRRSTDATGQPYVRYSFSRRQKRRVTPVNTPVAPTPRLTTEVFLDKYIAYCRSELGMSVNEARAEANDLSHYMEANA